MQITKDLKRVKPAPVDEEVKTLQRELKALGIDIGKDGVDGKFGDDTKKAVQTAQKQLKKEGDAPFNDGVVDKRFAEVLNKAFDATKIGQIIKNRRKKFDNKNEAIAELDKAIKAEKAKAEDKIDRVLLDDLLERKYGWLIKKLKETKEGVWKGIPGYVSFVPEEEEYFAFERQKVDEQFCLVINSGVNAIDYSRFDTDVLRCSLGSPQPTNPDDDDIVALDEFPNGIFAFTNDLLFLYPDDRDQTIADTEKELLATKTQAIANLNQALKDNPKASPKLRDDWRAKLDQWRARLDDELNEAGKNTSGGLTLGGETIVQNFLINCEKLELKQYKDTGGNPTIGVGHKFTPEELKTGTFKINDKKFSINACLTEAQARALLDQDLARFVEAVDESVKVKLNKCQRAALISFAFNVGIGSKEEKTGFKGSTLLKKLNKGDYESVPSELRRWIKETVIIDGVKTKRRVQGLVNRREKEVKLFLKEDG
ncbi:glycoside hydrolase family protein [Xenococcus sp. PCC 7305]|uniref:glycoside hydrolase family protein n=1 Tax=Xenococcus sp. PCC 7305 TaxID=102125 RepID=UPI00068A11B6|nr:glycoside hydrolase family protein [Xenococcus sp. PCC 7305]